MKEAVKSPFKLINFYVRESHIVLSKKDGEFSLNINIEPKGTIFKSSNTFVLEILLEVKEENEALNIEVRCVAVYEFTEPLNDNLPSGYFITNAPAIAFPYIRAYISTLTSQSGFETLTLPLLNLSPFAEELRKNIEIIE